MREAFKIRLNPRNPTSHAQVKATGGKDVKLINLGGLYKMNCWPLSTSHLTSVQLQHRDSRSFGGSLSRKAKGWMGHGD